jgi:hypothetical protein
VKAQQSAARSPSSAAAAASSSAATPAPTDPQADEEVWIMSVRLRADTERCFNITYPTGPMQLVAAQIKALQADKAELVERVHCLMSEYV